MSGNARALHLALTLLSATFLRADPGPMVLWYTNEATLWQQEALPVGNGKLAAMVFGGVTNEQIQFNEETIWTGQPHDYSHPGGGTNLALMQSYIFQTNQTAFWSLCSTGFMSVPLRQCAYQPAGVLSLTFAHNNPSNYLRSLDLNTATANVRYSLNTTTYSRDIFASAPDRVIVIRLTAGQPGALSFSYTFTSVHTNNTIATSGTDLLMHVNVTQQANSYTLPSVVQFDCRARVIAEGGSVTADGSSVSVANADAVTLLLSVASNVVNYDDISGDSALTVSNDIAAAAGKAYAALRQAHLADYQPLFQRVVLDLGATSKTNLPTGQRVKRAAEGDDPQLSALYFQMGRYLMISGSRPGAQPLTLQGKWNNTLSPSWESKMTLNINQELNYSGAEIVNLSECHQPMFNLVADLAVTGGKVARTNYNAGGWVAHHNTDLWRGAAPINGRDGVWPTGGAWLCQNLWWHFLYTGDTNFLANTAYPLMKGAAQFFEDFLVPHPRNTNWLVTCPSYSPEHDNPVIGPNVAGPTMDNDLIRELLNNVIQASSALGVDAAFRTNLMTIRDRLPPDQVGRFGQLQEWLEDVDGTNDTHRHCSHLVGLYPGEVITPYYTPTLAAAAKVSTDARGTGDIGWGKAWRIGLHARLQNANYAYLIHTNMLARDVSTNLMFTDVNNRQVDGIFGSLGSVAELFLQSQAGELYLLPALPPKWTNGLVSGLCARGGFQADLQWQSNQLVSATLLSKLGNPCRVRSPWPLAVKIGATFIDAPMVYPGVYEFPTSAGTAYTIVPANLVETEKLSATTGGDTHQILTNAAFSNSRGTRLNANAAADYVAYTLTNIAAGTWRVRVVADAGSNRGSFQLACGPSGALTNVGSTHDTYSATNVTGLYPSNSLSPVLLWTNMLKEFDCGDWTAPTNGNYQFRFTVTGKHAASSGYTLSFDHIKLIPATVAPSNRAPTDILLSNSSVIENQPAGTSVGTLSTADPDPGNTFAYTLVAGAGDTDNASFSISGNALQTAATFNYEVQTSHSIRVRTTDQGGLSFEKALAISVQNTNEPPTDLSLSGTMVTENQPAGTPVGSFTTTDPDTGNTFTYALVTGPGDADNAAFTIGGGALQTAQSFNFEIRNSYSVRVRCSDPGGLWFEKAFAISVTNTNEPPMAPANAAPAADATDQPFPITLQAGAFSDPDSGDTHAASQWVVRRAADSAVVFDSAEDATNKTTLLLPVNVLEYATAWQWQARYKDNHDVWSDYSTPTAFSTAAPRLTASAQNGSIVLAWPTNTTGFFLECATNLSPTLWVTASPPAVVVGPLKLVTNAIQGERAFYRLHRP
jgi:alpha-L-fucosidase 2